VDRDEKPSGSRFCWGRPDIESWKELADEVARAFREREAMKRILLVIVVGALLDQTEGRIKDLVSHPERRERSHRPDDAADMLIILPEEGRFEQVEERLNAGFLDGVSDELNLKYVRLTMARFDFETDLKLEKLLKIMGMEKPFSDADFSGMTGDRSTRRARRLRPLPFLTCLCLPSQNRRI
jgi:hypothetical protein